MSVLKLNSLQSLFRLLEEAQIENFTRRILILMRDGDFTLQQQRQFRAVLEKVASVTIQTQINFAVATAVIASETENLIEKKQLTDCLIRFTEEPFCTSEVLEITSRATVNLTLEKGVTFEEKKALQQKLYQMSIHPSATIDVVDVYAQGLFNLAVDEPTLEGKRDYTNRLKNLAIYSRGTIRTLVLTCKSLVNFMFTTEDVQERITCMEQLEMLANRSNVTTEVKHIFARGLLNFISEETHPTKYREHYFKKLEKLARGPNTTWVLRQHYAQGLLCMALNTEQLPEKRQYMRQIMKLVELPECVPEIFVAAARALFNHIIDEPTLKSEYLYLSKLERVMELSGKAPDVVREYARSLVNLAVEDPKYENKRNISEQLKRLSQTPNTSLDVVLEYAKSLINLTFTEENNELKRANLNALLKIDSEIHYHRRNLAEQTEIDYLCMKAEALVILISIESDFAQKRKLFQALPPVKKLRGSNYLTVLKDLFEEMMKKEQDWTFRNQLREYYETIPKTEGSRTFDLNLLTPEEIAKLPPDLVQLLREASQNTKPHS